MPGLAPGVTFLAQCRKLKNDVQENRSESPAAHSARSLAPRKFSPPRVHPKVQEAFDRYRNGFNWLRYCTIGC
ncbi:MAG: hypothetical protein WBC87_16000, partial [Pseudolabrys sp.]